MPVPVREVGERGRRLLEPGDGAVLGGHDDLTARPAEHLGDRSGDDLRFGETARDVADKTWDLVHDRPEDDPVKRRVVECHEALARLSARGGGSTF